MLKSGRYDVLVYRDRSGRSPYIERVDSLDGQMRERILSRVARLGRGQFGDFKALGQELYELRLFFGPGYRVYFGEQSGAIILILMGGDKSTQNRDIKAAREHWKIYREDNE